MVILRCINKMLMLSGRNIKYLHNALGISELLMINNRMLLVPWVLFHPFVVFDVLEHHLAEAVKVGNIGHLLQCLPIGSCHELLDRYAALVSSLVGTSLFQLVLHQRLQDLSLASQLLRQLAGNLGPQASNHNAVRRVTQSTALGLRLAQRAHPRPEVLDSRGAVAEDVVTCEHGALLLEDEANLVVGVTRCVHCAHGGALDAQDLSLCDAMLRNGRRALVDQRGYIRIHADQAGDPAGVVAVPVGEKDVRGKFR
ncbi:hypothetical protein VN97_g2904 [Penicillium thymicola]|uniref:Uncharacterized protein n=1 Tax=Penicillium thymicola TaxID=293382 RepID=A0AAI9TNK9_PENTH|nr:hypothetical protein VN97_g2904 [Penicillium thymicola]